MLFVYRILINIIFFLSPIIIIYRILNKKESLKRFKEKFCFFSTLKKKGNLVWFHGASVGELQSIVPILEKLEKNKNINQILVTSNTLSSSRVIEKYKFKKLTHQFFPIDTNFLSQKFLNYWKPSVAFFIDSEIWPNMIFNLKKKNVPIILLNGRITKRTFKNWSILSNFASEIFQKFNLCLSSSEESKKYLKKLGSKKVKMIGNLKYSQSENEKISMDSSLKNFINIKRTWCASSTHETEEVFCGIVHNKLKKKYKNLLTIIIPRHIERVKNIEESLKKLNLKIHLHEPKKKIKKDTDIYIVNTYGKTKSFYNNCKNIFLGGSIIDHGGQNPLEATRFGCNILHGPNINNFKEIYEFLKMNKISTVVRSQKQMKIAIDKLFNKKANTNTLKKKFNSIGQKILYKTYKEISFFL